MTSLLTNFIGIASISIADSRFSGPFTTPINLSPVFSADRKVVDLGSFPPITVGPFHTGTIFGDDTITVTKKQGGIGSFALGSGTIDIPLTLHFDHSLIVAGDSDLPLNLTTGTETSPARAFTVTGSPLNSTSSVVTLVGASAFKGGFLGGTDASVTITGTVSPSPFLSDQFMPPVFAEGAPGIGIGGYDLADPADRAFAYDYDGSGRLDHIALYRPGAGTMWILKNTSGTFAPVFAEGAPGIGIGGYDLADPADRAFAYDYDGSGRLDHIALYRPGAGTMWILRRH
jgi:hypothetical protein